MQGLPAADRQWETEPLLKKNDSLMVDADLIARNLASQNARSKMHSKHGMKSDLSLGNSWRLFAVFLKHFIVLMAVFMLVSFVFMFGFHTCPRILLALTGISVLQLLYISSQMYWSNSSVQAFMYLAAAFAIFSGGAAGTQVHLSGIADFYEYQSKRHYTNVYPTDPAGAHADASVLVFMDGSRPDGARATAYNRFGTAWCVAPISVDAALSDNLEVNTDIQYWAVGQDCCSHRGFTCGASQQSSAHSGLVMSKPSSLDAKLMGLLSTAEMSYYEKAISMSTAKYDITTPKDHLLVRFVSDIEEAHWASYDMAWWSWIRTQFLWGFVWVFASVFAVILGRDNYTEHLKDLKMGALHNLNYIM